MRRRSFLALGLLPVAAHAGMFSDTYEWRQKLTVTLDTPQGVKTGSSVTAISVKLKNTRGNRIASTTGEAAIVEVAEGRYLFVLLSGQLYYNPLTEEHTDELAGLVWQDVLPIARQRGVNEQNFDVRKEWGPRYQAITELRGARDMPVALWPAFVTFADLNDPASVKVIEPEALDEVFGPGVAVRTISLEVTREAVTDGAVGAVLPWLGTWKDMLIPVPKKAADAYTPEERIRRLNFKQVESH
jgi:hypothetical protein